VRSALRPCTLAAPGVGPLEAIGSGSQLVFQTRSGGPDGAFATRPPRGRGPDQQIQCWFADLVFACNRPGGLPLPQESLLLFSGFPLQAQLAVRPGLLGRPAGLKPADLASLDGRALRGSGR